MDDKLVSVIIPAYNAAVFIESTINSVLCQTYENFEIIVVNDGSVDNTLDIVTRIAEKDPRVKVFTQENGGVSAARNTALSKASGEYITCVDADDSLPKNGIETLVGLMRDDVDFVVCSHNEIRFSSTPHIEKPCEFTKQEINDNFRDFDRSVWWPWGKLLRRSIIEENNLRYDINITFGEDHVFNLLYAKHMKGKAVISDKVAYNYHFIRGGLCSKYYPDMNRVQKIVFYKIADYFGGLNKIPRKYQELYAGNYMIGCINYYLTWLPFKKATLKVEETINDYSDIVDDETMKMFVSDKQFGLIKNKDFKGFCVDYIIHNPKETIYRKLRRTVRRILELMQRIFLKRA